MIVRIVVPLKWTSPFRKVLFLKLKELNYTWSQGDSLDSDYPRLHRMSYVAIYVTEPIVKFSSNIELGQKPFTDMFYNYVIKSTNVNNIIMHLKYLQQYLSRDPEEEDFKEFIMVHDELKDNLLLLE